MDPIYIEGVSMDTNDNVVLKVKICETDTIVDIDIEKDEGVNISELLLDINDDKYISIYDLYIDSIRKRNLDIHSILITITDSSCYGNIILETKDNDTIHEDMNISVGAAIIIGLKTEKPIFKASGSDYIYIDDLKPEDFEF